MIEAVDEIFGSLQTRAGYTPAEIRGMLLTDVFRLFKYWQSHPTLYDMVAGFMGVKPQSPEPEPGEIEVLPEYEP